MKKALHDLFSALTDGAPLGNPKAWDKMWEEPISMLRCDSRLATMGTVFFCLVGKTSDGHLYAPSAYRNGCRVFVVEKPLELPKDALQFQVPDTRAALADCAAEFYDHPEGEMRLIGLTGTKGKTTTALLIRSLLEDGGIPTGYIGTNGVALSSTFMKLGLLVPMVLSIVFFGEMPGWLQMLGFFVAIGAMILINYEKGKNNAASAGGLILLLLAGGGADAMSKVFEVYGTSEHSDLFLFYTYYNILFLVYLK